MSKLTQGIAPPPLRRPPSKVPHRVRRDSYLCQTIFPPQSTQPACTAIQEETEPVFLSEIFPLRSTPTYPWLTLKITNYPVLSCSFRARGAQAAGGHGPERKQRIDWMYEGPMQTTQDQEAESNEYLMGKEVRPISSTWGCWCWCWSCYCSCSRMPTLFVVVFVVLTLQQYKQWMIFTSQYLAFVCCVHPRTVRRLLQTTKTNETSSSR